MESRMEAMMEILEQELEEAVEVKNKKSLHRYIVLLTENIVRKDSYEKEQLEIRSDIKILAEIVKQGFEHTDKRFEDMQKLMNKHFEAVDTRFEAVDKRFEDMQKHTDKRFEDMQKHTDKRLESVDKRFEDMNKKFSMMFTFMNIGFTIIVLLTVLFKFIA
jgi:replicative DNA helicase